MVAVRLAGLAVQARRYRGTASASQDFEKHFARCAVSIPLGPVQRSRATALCCRANGRASLDPGSWARTQNNLGNTLSDLGNLAWDPKRLEEAVAAFRSALEVQTREDMPADWAGTQNSLGIALTSLGDLTGDPKRLEEAAAASPGMSLSKLRIGGGAEKA